jgi:hypothetical protein
VERRYDDTVSPLTFAQYSRRNYTVPILIAVAVIGLAAGLVYRTLAARTVTATVTQTTAHPVQVLYKQPISGAFKVVGQNKAGETDLYLISTVRIENHLTDPLFLKDFTLSFTAPDGERHTGAIEKNDLDTVYTAFPEIKPLMATPLLRESEIAPGATAQGTVLAQFPIPQSLWDQRQSATLTIDLYHQPSINIPIP